MTILRLLFHLQSCSFTRTKEMSTRPTWLQLVFCILLLLQYHSLFPARSSAELCFKDDSSALLHLKSEFVYDEAASLDCKPPHFRMANWKLGTDCCSWDGVTCNNVTGRVTGLDLSCSGLSGNLTSNSSLFRLVHLRRLNLGYNYFNHSVIPSELGGFISLTQLNLSGAELSGQVPSEFSHLSQLVLLDLSSYGLRMSSSFGMIFGNLTQLREVYLDGVDMTSVAVSSLVKLSSSLVALSLSGCGLQGHFPEKIFHLPNLQYLNLLLNSDLHGYLPMSNWSSPLELLDLGGTNFSGELPDTIGNLSSLQVLDFYNCQFNGSVPVSLGNLGQLVKLDLTSNDFTGPIPDIFGNFSNLQFLSLAENNFSSRLPSSIFNATKLSHLDLSQNQLEGPLPYYICGLSSLTYLDLSYNLLSGTIPPCLFGLPSLITFYLSFNHLTGELGEFRSKFLQDIRMEANKMYGQIPKSVFELQNLTNFHVPSNNLSGTVDLNMFSKLKKLWGLDLSSNSISVITGNNGNSTWPQFYRLALDSCNITEFPDFLRTQNQLGFLSLSNNRIRGEVPTWFSGTGMNYLLYLDLSHNFLTRVSSLPVNLQYLGLSSNLLQQTLPSLPLPQSMYILLISNNKLTGEIPPLICNITTFQIIDLSNNSLSGSVPSCLGNFSNELSVLNLRENSFHGSIPPMCAGGSNLRNLDLNGNQLEGQIPRTLANCEDLEVLDLGNNKINDTFPQWLESLPKLQVLVLRSNNLHDPIGDPRVSSPFSRLRIIDISHNGFTGLLPTKYFANFHAVMSTTDNERDTEPKYLGEIYYQDSVVLTIKDSEIELVRILTIFTTIDLSSNSFGGQIPEVVGNLTFLRLLNLSHNGLTGNIPSSLGNLMVLESLDLSWNKLEGRIPEQLAELGFLAKLNLSYNQLSGPIPQGEQFATFQSNSYTGNLGLCGFPLPEKCSNETPKLPPSTPEGEEEEEEEDSPSMFDWKFALMGYGSGLVLGLSIGYIVLSTGRPFFFIRIVEGWQYEILRRRKQQQRRRGRRH